MPSPDLGELTTFFAVADSSMLKIICVTWPSTVIDCIVDVCLFCKILFSWAQQILVVSSDTFPKSEVAWKLGVYPSPMLHKCFQDLPQLRRQADKESSPYWSMLRLKVSWLLITMLLTVLKTFSLPTCLNQTCSRTTGTLLQSKVLFLHSPPAVFERTVWQRWQATWFVVFFQGMRLDLL